jgi:hypothetical protein
MFLIGFSVLAAAGNNTGTSMVLTLLAWPGGWLYFALFARRSSPA